MPINSDVTTAYGSKMTDPGLRTVQGLYRFLGVDAEWSTWSDRGFTWWASALAQQIWADPPVEVDGTTLSRVHVHTDVFSGFGETETECKLLGLMSRYATLSGIVRSTEHPAVLQLATALSVHHDVEESLTRLLAVVASLQLVEAQMLATRIEGATDNALRWVGAVSAHPSSGPRTVPDDMLNVVEQLVAPKGAEPSAWLGPELAHCKELLSTPPCIVANGDEVGLTAEFPHPEGTSMLRVITEEPHPRLGNGCMIRCDFPFGGEEDAAGRWAFQLNERDLSSDRHAYFLGSWCTAPHGLSFVTFLPNIAHQPGMLTNCFAAALDRVRWVTEDQLGYDMIAHFEEAEAAVVERLQQFEGQMGVVEKGGAWPDEVEG